MEMREGVVYLAISADNPDMVKVGQVRVGQVKVGGVVEPHDGADDQGHEDKGHEDKGHGDKGHWRIAHTRRVRHPRTIERMMREHLARLGGTGSGEAYAAPFGHAHMVLESLARDFGA